ncbi:MAG TPA: LuxR C-terminal-related transcriptional regulator [Gaiellaceae bacterium]|nr:LuxR C-terminal-related transcriptional regulator [Gaiellaceae bacterium]
MTAQGITELRLDYRDLASGQVMIVIDGFPAPGEKPLAEEARAVNEAAGCTSALVTSLVLAAWRGHEERATELAAAAIEDAEDMRRATAVAGHARAILCNGLGRYREALAAAQRACAHADLGSGAATLAELVEGAARAHAPGTAREALGRLEEQAEVGLRARSAALLAEGTRAEGLYRDAIEALAHGGTSAQLARARLVYGEWLRRERRRVDARKELRAAHETFSRIGAEAFAERALRELLATCETARKRTDDTRGLLTAQEAEIARLARDGLSNPEIGARLFISPRTVQYHLRKVFQKLSIRSRNQLGRIPSERLAA